MSLENTPTLVTERLILRKFTFRMYQLNLDGDNERVYKKYWNMYENHFVEEL